jgi:predicted Zn-dependent protease
VERTTFYWVAGGVLAMGLLAGLKWHFASQPRPPAPVVTYSLTNLPPGMKKPEPPPGQPAISNSPSPAVSMPTNTASTQDAYGEVLDVAAKAGERAGKIFSGTNASGSRTNKAKPGGKMDDVLELAADTARQLDEIGLERTQLTDAEEMEYGNKMDRQILKEMPEVSNPALLKRLQAIAEPLVAQSKRKGITYRIRIVESPLVNAFGCAGGHVYFTSSFLRRFNADADIAMVMGHEIAHIELKHAVRKVQYEYQGEKVVGDFAKVGQVLYAVLSSPYTKDQEFEADAAGFDMCRRAGWSAKSLLPVLEKLSLMEREKQAQAGGTGEPRSELERKLGNYFRSHPQTDERLARLKKRAGE